jgi:hypothetical protein
MIVKSKIPILTTLISEKKAALYSLRSNLTSLVETKCTTMISMVAVSTELIPKSQ